MTSKEMASDLKGELKKKDIDIIGCIYHDSELFEACFLGRPLRESGARKDISEMVDILFEKMR